MLLLLILFNVSISVLTVVQCASEATRPTENRRLRRVDRNANIDLNYRRQYVPLLPEWDSQLPEVFEESASVQAKVRAEDTRESVIDDI